MPEPGKDGNTGAHLVRDNEGRDSEPLTEQRVRVETDEAEGTLAVAHAAEVRGGDQYVDRAEGRGLESGVHRRDVLGAHDVVHAVHEIGGLEGACGGKGR